MSNYERMIHMMNIEQARKQFDRFIEEKNFNLSDDEVVKKAIELENNIKKSQVI